LGTKALARLAPHDLVEAERCHHARLDVLALQRRQVPALVLQVHPSRGGFIGASGHLGVVRIGQPVVDVPRQEQRCVRRGLVEFRILRMFGFRPQVKFVPGLLHAGAAEVADRLGQQFWQKPV